MSAGKPLSGKVAIVSHARSELGAAFSFKLAQKGFRLLLAGGDDRLAQDLNILVGLDPNYLDIGLDPWGSRRAVAVNVDLGDQHAATSLVQTALDAFGSTPDLLVDCTNTLSTDFVNSISTCWSAQTPVNQKTSVVRIKPDNGTDLLTPGWLGSDNFDRCLDRDQSEACDEPGELDVDVAVYAFCGEAARGRLTQLAGKNKQSVSVKGVWGYEMRSNDCLSLAAYLLTDTNGWMERYINVSQVEEKQSGWVSLTARTVHWSQRAEIEASNVLKPKSENVIVDNGGEIDLIGYGEETSEESLLTRTWTFDLELQKEDAYPEDIWGPDRIGQSKDPSMNVMDDDCALSFGRSAANYVVKCLFFGYIALAIAAPSVVGWSYT